jgi:acyl-CoA reductase-like NAD-dependent aldehyde dehydrogenase
MTAATTLQAVTTLHRTSPIDLHALSPVPRASEDDIRRALANAREAQTPWREVRFEDRAAALVRAAKSMLRRRDEGMSLAHDEVGKLDVTSLFDEGIGHLDVLKQWIGVVRPALERKRVRMNPLVFPKKQSFIDVVPRGVVGVIAPWNFPIAGLYRALYPALLCGNGVIVKPSEYSPLTTQWLVDSLARELPAGLITCVHGDAAQGAMLIDAGIDACVFTGSPRSGRAVGVRCAERGIPASIEMGGKDCAIVLADCDRERTLAGITHWTLANSGQACGAIEVALVEDHFADDFGAALARSWVRLRTEGEHAEVSPLGNRRQLEIVQQHVDDALAKGAKLLCGGAPTGHGLGFMPTLLDHCREDMMVVRDETFGPVLAIVRVDGPADAIRRVNRARYGLGASIWTRDIPRATALAEQLEVGVASINNHAFTGAIPALPWTGTRETGFGVANSVYALSTFIRPRTTVIDGSSRPEPYWMPYDRDVWEFGQLVCDAQLAKVTRAWRLPILAARRLRTIRRFFSG